MNPPTVTARLRDALRAGPQSIDALTTALGVTRTKLHKLINRQGLRIVRDDCTPTCGRFARPVYRLRPALTGPSRAA